jgi:hypothetical protein
MAALRTYAPYIVFPVAATIGVIGYNIESLLSDRYTPWRESTITRREQRRLEEQLNPGSDSSADSLKNPDFVPKNIFERNTSPTLKKVS